MYVGMWGFLIAFKTIRCAFKTSYESERLKVQKMLNIP
jgi:hypothetical protein